ncbi:hypothetical protein DV735_g4581, partial [Chaetothyriales sp. CBS 134920]
IELFTSPARMRATLVLRNYAAKLTLFTGKNCSLCDVAKGQLAQVRKRRAVEYSEVDITADGNQRYRELYKYDIPVLHIDRAVSTKPQASTPSQPKVLMHRFKAEDVEKLIDETEQGSA